jgi:hypothetical protein
VLGKGKIVASRRQFIDQSDHLFKKLEQLLREWDVFQLVPFICKMLLIGLNSLAALFCVLMATSTLIVSQKCLSRWKL